MCKAHFSQSLYNFVSRSEIFAESMYNDCFIKLSDKCNNKLMNIMHNANVRISECVQNEQDSYLGTLLIGAFKSSGLTNNI